jgi:hypothetical protein
MRQYKVSVPLLFFLGLGWSSLAPAQERPVPVATAPSYADLADLALAAPIAAHVEVTRARALGAREAAGAAAGHRRFLVEARIVSLIRGPSGLPASVRYLVDLPNDLRGRAARVPRRGQFLLFAAPVQERPGELRLTATHGQLPFTQQAADQVRAILREATSANAPPRITGPTRAFHTAGALPGASQTQIFLETADRRPVSLNVLRSPGAQPRWSVAISESVGAAVPAPRTDTLLWYRLACSLPPSLPAQSVAELDPDAASAVAADYRLVISQLGPCTRTGSRSVQ